MTTEISARLAEMVRAARSRRRCQHPSNRPSACTACTGRAGPTRSPTNRYIARQRPWRYIEGYARRYQWTIDHPIPVT